MHSKKKINQKNDGGQVSFHGRFTPLTSYALPFSLSLNILFYKKFELLVSNLKSIHIDF